MEKEDARFLRWGYVTAIILALAGLIFTTIYLFIFLIQSNKEILNMSIEKAPVYSAERKMVLCSTAIFVAMAFGFLGFSLFLIQAKGEVEGSLDYKDAKVNIVRMSPGIFVILCATVIIILSIRTEINYKLKPVFPANIHPNEETQAEEFEIPERVDTIITK